MQTTLQGTELSVAILMDDFASAKEIAGALRLQNILAHHYLSLDEFWVATNVQVPDLVIVDVIKMSQGSIQFRNHPKVVDKSMCYAFFSKDTTKVLLQSTFGLDAFGYLHHDITIGTQVLGMVKRRVKEMKMVRETQDLELRIQRLQTRSQRLITERTEAEEFKANFEFIRTMCSDIENSANKQGFSTALLNKLDQWDSVDGFGLFELNQSGQKLIAPDLSRKKYHPFPSLWLGLANLNGIELFAQDMAAQVANDLFEDEPVMIQIHGAGQGPEMLLFVSFKQEQMVKFPWDILGAMLSSSLRRLKLHQQMPRYATQFMPLWEALDNMDRLQKIGSDAGDVRILCLSFVPLMNLVKRRANNKFYWSAFFNDFFLQLSGRVQKSTKLSLLGPWQVIFFIPKETMDSEFQSIQSFIKQFHFWRFFEDNSQLLPEDIWPTLRLVPPSSTHYLGLFEKEFEDMATANESKRLMALTRQDQQKRIN